MLCIQPKITGTFPTVSTIKSSQTGPFGEGNGVHTDGNADYADK
jgi:hypothetical protein